MRKTKPVAAVFSVAFGLWLSALSAHAQDDGTCSISDGRVVCADSTADRKAVFDALANPKSAQYFNNLLAQPGFSLDIKRRETYRRSLERNRRAMHRYARAQHRNYRRRKIDSATYDEVVAGYKSAVKTYRAAMNVYRGTVWHSKFPSRYAD